jgi:murein DD-endopeptidase MepM/ murein hydrolase activator NlpD
MGKLTYDKESLTFVEKKKTVGYYLKRLFVFLGYSILSGVIIYLAFSLIVTTEKQRKIKSETRLIQQEYERLSSEVQLLEEVLGELQVKDEQIYYDIFNSSFPDYSMIDDSLSKFATDSTLGSSLVFSTQRRLLRVENEFEECGVLLSFVNDSIGILSHKFENIPDILPVADWEVEHIGASVGEKIHPFYKKLVFHDGLDILVPMGTEVISTADGVVESVTRSKKLDGTNIVLNHGNGYKTMYAHLSDVLVRKGQKIQKGKVIARVGSSGTSFAPHLHYEILKDGEVMDPLSFVAASVDTETYMNMLSISVNTGQSLD